MKVWIDQTKRCAAFATSRTPPLNQRKALAATAELERPHAAHIVENGQDLPRRRDHRADRGRGAIRLGEGEDRGLGRHPSRSACIGTEESGARCARLNGLSFRGLLCWRFGGFHLRPLQIR
jgi:hypothetical protein